MTTSEMDQARSEAFAERMIGVLNDGALALMTSIGHRTGLFDAMAGLPPSSSEQIASASELEQGGGVPYSAYTRFHEVMAEDSGQTVVAALTGSILPLVPGLTDRLAEGIDVLDVGCGSGRALNLLARKFPNSHFVGYDFSEEAISRARVEAQERGATNVRFEVRDVADLGEEERYDLITTFDAVHDQAKPAAVLAGIAAALRGDGVYLMQDIAGSSHLQNNMDHPLGPFMYTVSTMHCMTVSLAQGGEGLGTMWGEEKATEMLKDAGFGEVEVKRLPHDFQNTYYIAKKD
jgi:2-polyprenyl-3-methyl-5-hydroxy-6-metoxy-1,4-benzoquinol methylase